MPNYRRAYVPGGTFFFTVVTYDRRPILCTELGRLCLREAIKECREKHPFEIIASVLLPDHLHTIWSLPQGDTNYSKRWGIIKANFTKQYLKNGGVELETPLSKQNERRRGIWQPRFWEHTIQDQEDLEKHFHYIHFNPVKHKYVERPYEWKWSTFHQAVLNGDYDKSWTCGDQSIFTNIEDVAGE